MWVLNAPQAHLEPTYTPLIEKILLLALPAAGGKARLSVNKKPSGAGGLGCLCALGKRLHSARRAQTPDLPGEGQDKTTSATLQ
jgi:hypothetical protein